MLACIDCVAKVSDHSIFKKLSSKELLQRLPIALVPIKAGDTSGNLLNEIRQIVYSLYWTKEIYNNVMNSI